MMSHHCPMYFYTSVYSTAFFGNKDFKLKADPVQELNSYLLRFFSLHQP